MARGVVRASSLVMAKRSSMIPLAFTAAALVGCGSNAPPAEEVSDAPPSSASPTTSAVESGTDSLRRVFRAGPVRSVRIAPADPVWMVRGFVEATSADATKFIYTKNSPSVSNAPFTAGTVTEPLARKALTAQLERIVDLLQMSDEDAADLQVEVLTLLSDLLVDGAVIGFASVPTDGCSEDMPMILVVDPEGMVHGLDLRTCG